MVSEAGARAADCGSVNHFFKAARYGSSVSERMRSIDLLRAIAACSVVLFHSSDSFYLGAAGVDLFFVISGLVIARVSIGRSAPEFLVDRASRIFPLYWLAMLPWIAAAAARGTLNIVDLAADLLLLPRLFFDIQPLLILSWTLTFELLFYGCAAACIRLGSWTQPVMLMLGLMIVAGITGSPILKWVGNPIILEFLMGAAIYRAPKTAWMGSVAIVCGVILFALSPPNSGDVLDFQEASSRVLTWGIPSALIVYGLVTMEHRLKGPVVDRLCWLGVASYSIYLFHPFAIALVLDPWWARLLLGVGTGVLAWALAERQLETARRRWRRVRRSSGWEAASSVSESSGCDGTADQPRILPSP